MGRITGLLLGTAAWAVVSTVVSTVAEAADGCGRGWFYNGERCVPQEGVGPRYYGRRDYGRAREYYGPPREEYEEPPPDYQPPPRYYEPPVAGPQFRLEFGPREEPQYYPPNPGFRTWNNCPPTYTIQDGVCKPYSGR
ncbi:MAG TPA: hypothetical protein VGH39_17170 [Xanthobacteraceae bacterium]|jgi:hypothetical protein